MKKHSQIVLFALSLCVLFLNLNCKKDNPIAPPNNTFSLTAADANCTEVYLQLTVGAALGSRTLTLMRDTIQVLTMSVASGQTTLTDTNLLPGHTYNYIASLSGSLTAHTSAKTMDTSSHSWSFTTTLLGDGSGSSTLFDVAIINDTLAYAVGAIYQGGSVYNLAKWNGQAWQLLQIQFYTICGQQSTTSYPTSSIFVFSDHDIWIAMDGDQVARFDGNIQTATMCMPVSFSIKKLWGTNPSSVYAVGSGGNIVHYDGTSWTQIVSGTSYDIRDIYGAENEILAVASNSDAYRPQGRTLLHIDPTTYKINTVPSDGLAISLNAIWFVPSKLYLCGGDGLFHKHDVNPTSSWQMYPIGLVTNYYSDGISGNAINDVFIGCAFLEIVHFNGVTWKNYRDQIPLTNGALTIKMRGNFAVAVGLSGQQAIATVGKR